ncbi:hypothetical protein CDD81_189 [Ophiocordyceps australis]|uniref:Carboxylic ester hydrolase n=1 Tax=Ophiocordyceps australis TaxID=1399860 RepID=A0A2C5YEJ6_9HYPO|nr:hypothetical protein CDD81_189 [Ophiocordyceps australis]
MIRVFYITACAGLSSIVSAQQNRGNESSSANPFFTGGDAPIVDLGHAKYRGIRDELTQTSNYLGIPYIKAQRFDHGRLYNDPLDGIQSAMDYAPACPQHSLGSILTPSDPGLGFLTGLIESIPPFQRLLRTSEDCLFINVQRPRDQTLRNLPVLAWIHGGGFEGGSANAIISETTAIPGIFYQGANIVRKSIDMGRPIVFASFNYRLAHFGFSASRELQEAGLLNLGFEDQRLALKWIQKHIAAFGGDPSKVTIMGESAGSWSVAGHLVAGTSDGQGPPLFRGAVGMSGGLVKVDGPERQQSTFDSLVDFVGCKSASDIIECLRSVPYESIHEHMQTVPAVFGFRSMATAWTLRPDGKFFPQSPHKCQVANVPLLCGDVVDEGTLFALVNSLNLTSTALVKDYMKKFWWPHASSSELDRLLSLYPQDPTRGSPYGTGLLYSLPLQYKRLASIIGDYTFQAQRRALLGKSNAPKWNYLMETSIIPGSSLLGPIPLVGSFHGSDVLLHAFGNIPEGISQNTRHFMSALVSFVNDLNPNTNGATDIPFWPEWSKSDEKTMRFRETGNDIIRDDYRKEGMGYINEIGDSLLV